MDRILDHDNIHRFGSKKKFSDKYDDEAMDTSNYDLPSLESNQEG